VRPAVASTDHETAVLLQEFLLSNGGVGYGGRVAAGRVLLRRLASHKIRHRQPGSVQRTASGGVSHLPRSQGRHTREPEGLTAGSKG